MTKQLDFRDYRRKEMYANAENIFLFSWHEIVGLVKLPSLPLIGFSFAQLLLWKWTYLNLGVNVCGTGHDDNNMLKFQKPKFRSGLD